MSPYRMAIYKSHILADYFMVVTVQGNEIYGDRTNIESKKARTPEHGTN